MEIKKDKKDTPATTTTTNAATNYGFLDAKSLAPLIAGLAGGSISTALLLPLDNVKVRLQVNEESGKTKINTTTVRRPYSIFRFRSMRLLGGIIKHEGFVGLYQGMAPALMGSSLGWGGYFYLYEGFKQQLKSHNQSTELSSLENFEMACSAGAVMVFLTNPFWLIKLRMQLQMKRARAATSTKQPYAGMIDAARTIIREEGPLALYKGTGPALLLTSHGGVQFVVYEFLRKNFNPADAKPNTSTSHSPDGDEGHGKPPILQRLEKSLAYLLMGATAKIIASTVTYPLQVVKARMQQRSEFAELTAEGEVRVVQRQYGGIANTFLRIWEKEGLAGFFKGCIANAVRVAPSAAITFVVYEATMDELGVR